MTDSISEIPKDEILKIFGFVDIPENWDIKELGQILSSDRGISVGVMYPGDHDPLGIPLIKVTDLKENRINPKPDFCISKSKHQEYIRTEFQSGELLITLVGDVGKCAIVPLQMKGFNAARAIGVLRFQNQEDVSFIRWCLLTAPIHELMIAWSNTTVQTTLNLKEIKKIPIPWPPKKERGAIARILSSLDDKIELNRQMNETLEAMARTIFQSWFVDFDPVRAKAEGRDTGLPTEVAALFPSEIVEVDGREVPKGWGVESLGNVIEMKTGKSYTSDELQESTTALVTLKSFQRGGGYRQDGLKPFIGKYKPEQVIRPGELVISFTDVTQAAEVIGKPAIVSANPEFQTLIASLDVGIIRPKDERVNTPFLYLLLRNEDYQSHIYGYCSGTTVLHLNKSGVPKYEFICPDPEIMKIFYDISEPIFDEIQINIEQSRTLAQIRDALLPKLMSGEVGVSTS